MSQTSNLTDTQQAAFLRDSSAGLYLSASVGPCLGNQISPTGFKEYLANLRQSAGSSSNPLEQLLWEQLALGHHNLGRLYSRAAEAKTIDEVGCYSSITNKLHGELRLLSETLHRIQKSGGATAADNSSSPHKQTMAAARPADLENSNTQQGSKPTGDDHEPSILPFTESQPRRRRSPKSVAAARAF